MRTLIPICEHFKNERSSSPHQPHQKACYHLINFATYLIWTSYISPNLKNLNFWYRWVEHTLECLNWEWWNKGWNMNSTTPNELLLATLDPYELHGSRFPNKPDFSVAFRKHNIGSFIKNPCQKLFNAIGFRFYKLKTNRQPISFPLLLAIITSTFSRQKCRN